MKKYILSTFFLCFLGLSYGQIIDNKTRTASHLFLPSNQDPSSLRPSDIPSEQVLIQMGLSDEEIKEALDFKFSRGKYSIPEEDSTLSFQNSLQLFYKEFGDTITDIDSVTFPIAKIYGQGIFRNNELSFFQKSLDANPPENYKIGPGDEMSISAWGYSDYSDIVEVDSRGYITPSGFGRIYVKGLSFSQMQSLVKKRLGMRNSQIDITLIYSRVIMVNIVGEVYNPGSYSIPAINTAFNALIAANGPNQIGSVRNIYIKRNGKVVDSLDVYQFMFNPSRSHDIYLQDGDFILVPPASNLVEVKGSVNRPYTYEIKKNDNAADIIMYAGGYATNAFQDIITLRRYDYNEFKVHDIYKGDLKVTKLKNGDEIVVNHMQAQSSNFVTLMGSVGIQGDYEYQKGEKLLSLLERSKSINQRAYLENVYVLRLNEDRSRTHISVDLRKIIEDPSCKDNIVLREYDIVQVLSLEDFDDDYNVTVKGSVRSEGEYLFGQGLSLKDVLTLSGGIKQEASGSRIEIYRVMEINESNRLNPTRSIVKSIYVDDNLDMYEINNTSNLESGDKEFAPDQFFLQPYDHIFVRKNPDFEEPTTITILGEVKFPGTYSLMDKTERISSIIERSGGLTDYAYLDGTQLYRRFTINEAQLSSSDVIISDDFKDIILSNPELYQRYKDQLLESDLAEKDVQIKDQDKYDMVYLDLHKALKSGNSKHNLVLNDRDSIIIPKTMDIVHISGDLINLEGNSISAPYFELKRANFYVKNFAGGFSKENNKKQTIVIYPNGIVKKSLNFGIFSIPPKVIRGSTIKVTLKESKKKKKKRDPIDWNVLIENTMTKLSAAMTIILLADRIQQ